MALFGSQSSLLGTSNVRYIDVEGETSIEYGYDDDANQPRMLMGTGSVKSLTLFPKEGLNLMA